MGKILFLLMLPLFLYSCGKIKKECVNPSSCNITFAITIPDTSALFEKYAAGTNFATSMSSYTGRLASINGTTKYITASYNQYGYWSVDYKIVLYPSGKEYRITEVEMVQKTITRANNDSYANNTCYNDMKYKVNGKEYFNEGMSDFISINIDY